MSDTQHNNVSLLVLSVGMLNVAFYLLLWSVIMLNVVRLNVVMLSVVAPATVLVTLAANIRLGGLCVKYSSLLRHVLDYYCNKF
jgi:hypothetical protein